MVSKRKRTIGIIGLLAFVIFIVVVSYIFVKKFGTIIESPLEIRKSIAQYGSSAYIVYFLLYIFQIFFAPVPGQVLNVASGMLFGTWRGFFLSWAAGISGGFLAIVVSRYLGRRVLYWFLEEKAAGFEKEISRRGLPLITFLALFPNPIGDGLFYLAGLTNIPIKLLLSIIALARIPGILVYVIAGDKIMMAGARGWLIGGIGFLLAIGLYVIFGKKFEKIFEKALTSKCLEEQEVK